MHNIGIRRTKATQVNGRPLVELPPRDVHNVSVSLDKATRAIYDAWSTAGEECSSKGEACWSARRAVCSHCPVPASQRCSGSYASWPLYEQQEVTDDAQLGADAIKVEQERTALISCHGRQNSRRTPSGGWHAAPKLHQGAGDHPAPAADLRRGVAVQGSAAGPGGGDVEPGEGDPRVAGPPSGGTGGELLTFDVPVAG